MAEMLKLLRDASLEEIRAELGERAMMTVTRSVMTRGAVTFAGENREPNDREFAIIQMLAVRHVVQPIEQAETDACLLAKLSDVTRARILIDGKSIP